MGYRRYDSTVRKIPSSDLNVNSFKIYVTDDLFFDANLPKLEIRNNENSNDYKDNPYLAALFPLTSRLTRVE